MDTGVTCSGSVGVNIHQSMCVATPAVCMYACAYTLLRACLYCCMLSSPNVCEGNGSARSAGPTDVKC